MTLTTGGIAALARAYVHWESKRSVPTILGLRFAAERINDMPGPKAAQDVDALLKQGFLAANGKGEGDRREVEITPLGIAWFEANCDYWRECNVYRYHSRFGTAGCFEYDPRRPLSQRLLDPLVAGAAIAGAAVATLLTWLIP